VDDIGDEAPGDRLALLDRFEDQLDAAYDGRPVHPVLVALQGTIEQFGLPREPLLRLIEANRMDQRLHRYESYEQLLEYCAHSANPVGRLFLALFGYRDDARIALSDATCTALQLTNFWQDIQRDRASGRVYLPQDEMAAHGVEESDLDADRASAPLRSLVRIQVERTRRLFVEGLPLLDTVRGRLRVDLALFSRGGLAVLRAIEDQEFDTLVARPTLRRGDKLGLILSSILSPRWRRTI
jgi:squalene synthase HpnC